jgi:glucokinase
MIGIDLGGTRVKGIVIDMSGNIVHQIVLPTHDGEDALWKEVVKSAVAELLSYENGPITIGISAPGLPNEDHTSIAYMPGRLQGLEHFDWSDFLGYGTAVLNDGIAALIAEARYGIAKNKKHVVMLTLGTGVGGAIMIDGKPYFGHNKKAGHIGHMVINDADDCDVTGMPGSIEECIGNCTIEKRTNGRYSSTRQLLDDYANGNEYASQVWLKSVQQLAIGLASLSNILSPEVIVLGGGITEANEHLFVPLEIFMKQYEWKVSEHYTPIVKAHFGEVAGAIGAACFGYEWKKH